MLNENKKIHFIAIGGSIMHALAIALHEKGYDVSGSDDQIFGASKANLERFKLLPEPGWHPHKITKDLHAVILGMHAKADNPELTRAQELGLPIYSYPDYIMQQCQDKQRIVISGSHGKTSITAMIMHVLNFHNREFDYLVGSAIEGFDRQVRLTDAPVIIIEGDEYLSSPLDSTPKFLKYQHHIGLISGVAWDHMNVFPSEDVYIEQFFKFSDALPKAGSIIYCEDDSLANKIGSIERVDVNQFKYSTHPHVVRDGKTYLITPENNEIELEIFGTHNMQNLAGALEVLLRLCISPDQFYEAIQSFKGASRRLELIGSRNSTLVYKDFAHAPSKAKATIKAVKEISENDLVACLELHTYSSLNKDFLPQYAETMNEADFPVVYFNPNTLAMKSLPSIDKENVKNAFQLDRLKVFTDTNELTNYLKAMDWKNKNLLLMSSGNFGGLDLNEFGQSILN